MNMTKLDKWIWIMLHERFQRYKMRFKHRKQIVANFHNDSRVSPENEQVFLEALAKNSKKCIDAQDYMNIDKSIHSAQCQCKHLMLQGPAARKTPPKFAFVLGSECIPQLLGIPSTDQEGKTIAEDPKGVVATKLVERKLRLGLFDSRRIKPFGNSYGFLWSTSADDIMSDHHGKLTADHIRDKLGLDDKNCFGKGQDLWCFSYNRKDNAVHHCPTVIEGGGHHPFRPTTESDDTGFTMNLRNGERGYPEFVRNQIHNIGLILESVDKLGPMQKDPSQKYLGKI